MKIILSQAGGGKTTKVAELASEYTNNGKNVQIISDEILWEDFQWHIHELKISIQKEFLTYDFKTTLGDILNNIIEQPNSEIVFVDGIYAYPQEKLESRMKLIKAIEDYTGKEIYVTTQANMNHNILNGEKLIVLDYEEYFELSK